MTGLKSTKKSELLDTIENLVKFKSAINKEYEPWYKAIVLVKEGHVDQAAFLVSKSFDQSSFADPVRRLVVDEISSIALFNHMDGPGIESMWSAAMNLGYLDLAYNAGNKIFWQNKHKTVADYELASRYFHMAIQGSECDAIKYSAMTSYAEIVRDGLITGKKDWLGAISLYEEAGSNGLIKAMFNAGNVLLWLVEAGDRSYSSRAKSWFENVIEHVESGKKCIDLGGEEEVSERLKSSKIRLAVMHIDNLLDTPDLIKARELLADYSSDDRVKKMLVDIASAQELNDNFGRDL